MIESIDGIVAREMPNARDGNIVKIAVEMDSTHTGNYVIIIYL
jgi:hypothetical protein